MAHPFQNSSLASTPMTSVLNSSLLALHDDTTLANQESFRLVERFTIYITLFVSIVGLIGNACTIIVLNSVSMRKWRSSILLTALAVADFLYLSIIFLSIIDTLSNQAIGLHRSLILCQTTVYITHVCSFLSANFTLSFTLQRFVAVLFPLHANTIISSRSSTINILLLIIIGCSFYSLSFLLTNTRQGVCREDERYPSLFPFLIVDTCLTFVVPFIFIVIFNCAIVYKLRKRKKFEQIFGSVTTASNGQSRGSITQRVPLTESKDFYEQQRLQPSNSTEQENEDPSPVKKKKPAKRPLFSRVSTDLPRYSKRMTLPRASTMTIGNELTSVPSSSSSHNRQTISQRTTNMLVICSTTFLLFNSPYCAVLLYSIITNNFLTEVLDILRYFYFMSFCLNFFLYSLCGHRFRQELILLLKRGAKRCCSKTIYSQCSRLEKIPSRATV